MKDAKALTGQFKTDIDASKGCTAEDSEDVENEDEKDQAKVSFCCSFIESFSSIVLLSRVN